jgi:hypothetical protein
MAALSDYLRDIINNYLFRDGTFNKPSELAICLSTDTVTASDTGAVATEVADGVGYSRQVLGPADADWSASNYGITNNQGKLSFGTASANWGTVKYVFITDSSTYGEGNLLMYGPLTINRDVYTNDTFEINISDLKFELD